MSARSRQAERVAQAFAAHRSGQLAEAERLYLDALRAEPQHFDALHMLGALRVQRGDCERAADALSRACRLRPEHARAHFNLGVAELKRGRAAAALEAFDRAHALDARHAPTLHSRGNALAQLGRDAEALGSYERSLALAANAAAVWQDRARVALRVGQYTLAAESAERALALVPGLLEPLEIRATALAQLGRIAEATEAAAAAVAAWRSRRQPADAADPRSLAQEAFEEGNLLAAMRRFEEAGERFRAARALAPDFLEAEVNEASVLAEAGDNEEAARRYRAALERDPASLPALLNLARLLLGEGQPAPALALVERALAIAPDSIEALGSRAFAHVQMQAPDQALAECNALLERDPLRSETFNVRGLAQLALGESERARRDFERAIELAPNSPLALLNHGLVCRKLGQFREAQASLERGVRADPRMGFLRAELIHTEQIVCDWRRYDAHRVELAGLQRAGTTQLTTYSLIAALDDPALQRDCARSWSASSLRTAGPPLWCGERYDDDRIRVAYLSADFMNHATTVLIAGLFEAHDRERFETIGVSFSMDDDTDLQHRVRAGFDRFIDVRRDSDRAVAQRLRELEVDIAVDLKGHTAEARLGIFAHRPAPVQVTYLGYPGTTGAPFIDYLIADEFVIPAAEREWYDEHVVSLPDSYQVNDRKRPMPGAPPTRETVGLPDGAFVFCSFNNNYKITPQVFDAWMRLLGAVPGSVLWLLEDNAVAAENLRREAEARGIAPGRLVFAPRRPLPEHLARLGLADLFLDTLPCNAHTTASDALWAALPVLTCAGRSFPARVAGSLLRAAGLGELVTHSLDEYEALALALARDRERLGRARKHLEAERGRLALFDTVRFTRALESAYERMVERALAGRAPVDFSLDAASPPGPG